MAWHRVAHPPLEVAGGSASAHRRTQLPRLVGTILLVAAIALDVFATASLASALGVASDLYPRWLGTNAWLTNGVDPYALEIAERIRSDMGAELGWDGRADSGAFAFGFVYPGYTALLLAPLAILPFPVAATVWLLLAQGAIVGATILLWRTTPGAPTQSSVPEVIAVALAVIWPPAFFNIIFGQFAALVTVLLVVAATLARRGRGVGAGIALAVAMVKPQLGLAPAFLGFFTDLYALARARICPRSPGMRPRTPFRTEATPVARGRVALSSLAAGAILVGASLVALPGWMTPFLAGVADYARAAKATSATVLLADAISRLTTGTWPTRDLPGTFEALPLSVGVAVVAAILFGWRRQSQRDPGVPSAIAAGVLGTAWLIPPVYEWNHVTCLLILVPWVRRGGLPRAVAWLAASLATFPMVLAWPDGSRVTWPVILLAVWLHDACAKSAPTAHAAIASAPTAHELTHS